MVEWLAGNRIRGTTAERPALGLASGSVGGWVELGRTTLGSAGDTMAVSSFADKRYYMIMVDNTHSGAVGYLQYLGNGSADIAANYARRNSYNGGADGTAVSQTSMNVSGNGASFDSFEILNIANLSTKEKLVQAQTIYQSTAGAATAPNREEAVAKWVNTSNPLNYYSANNIDTGSFNTGSEVVVLGWDPTDTHTTNFWEELATTTISSAGELDTGSFDAKKYLYVQYHCNSTDGGFGFRFNSDTATKYARRFSQNGATDQTELNYNMMRMIWSAANTYYGNMFIINNSANEKLVINNQVGVTATGAGTAPYRWETAGKWITTGSQITSIQFLDHADASGYIDDGTVTVWGSD